MHAQPRVEVRTDQPYVAVPVHLALQELHVVDGIFFELFGWLEARGVPATGPPFIRYLVLDTAARLEIEVGIAVAATVVGDAQVRTGLIPGGSYATLAYEVRDEARHSQADADLQVWAAKNGLRWKNDTAGDREVWGGRFEFYPAGANGGGPRIAQLAYLIDERLDAESQPPTPKTIRSSAGA